MLLFISIINSQTLIQSSHNKIASPYQAVITHPVVDMTCAQPTKHSLSASPSPQQSCSRSHQGLYNEIITCIKEDHDFVQVSFRSIQYNTNGKVSTFWTEKKNIIPLKKIKKNEMLQIIPHPEYGHGSVIILIYPWKHFSVGTRFKYAPAVDTSNGYRIIYTDYVKNKIMQDTIPFDHAIKEIKQDDQAARQLFVTIINNLVERVKESDTNHVIPYVWGGSSFIHTYQDNQFHQDHHGSWQRHGHKHPYMGYDCSEFVMRMAQIAGLDFPWKTTVAIKSSLQKLARHDTLQNGDLIWFQGHVMIISNIESNEAIEARGYPGGYGRIHKIKLSELFENITTYKDLLKYYYAQKPLRLKNKEGKFSKKIDSFLLLKLVD